MEQGCRINYQNTQYYYTRQLGRSVERFNYSVSGCVKVWEGRSRSRHDGVLNVTHLTLVRAVVTLLHVFDLQIPVISSLRVHNLEPLVVCVSEETRRQDMPVATPDPRHL